MTLDRVAFTDFGQDVYEQPQCRHRDADRMGHAFVVEDLDLLGFRTGLQVGRQRPAALAGDGNFFGRRQRMGGRVCGQGSLLEASNSVMGDGITKINQNSKYPKRAWSGLVGNHNDTYSHPFQMCGEAVAPPCAANGGHVHRI